MLQDKASRGQPGSAQDQEGQQLHVSGVFIVILELALVVENTLPILVVVKWLPSCARGVSDRLIAAFSVTCILSALIPTPLGLASYFSGSWYGGSPTCTTYQVTSIWCNLSSLALLAYICVNCRFAVRRLVNLRLTLPTPSRQTGSRITNYEQTIATPPLDMASLPSTDVTSERKQSDSEQILTSSSRFPAGRLEINSLGINDDASHDLQGESKFPSTATENRFCEGVKKTALELGSQGQDDDCVETAPRFSKVNGGPFEANHTPQNQSDGANGTVNTLSRQHQDGLFESAEVHENNHVIDSSNSDPTKLNYVSNQDHDHHTNVDDNQTTSCTMYDTKYMLRNPLIYEDSTFIYTQSMGFHSDDNSNSKKGSRKFRPRDYVSLVLFFVYSVTLAISSLPVVGFGPQHRTNDKMCNSWLVPTPSTSKEKTFFIFFLVFVYLCLLLGCASGAQVCILVNRRLRQESKRSTRLYHEEENVPDIREFSILDDLKRHYSLACLVLSGILTWLPIVVMLTLQKSGVKVSEATLVYSNIATSLPGLLNPLLYSLVLVRYRDGYKAVFEKCCRRKGRYRQHPMKSVGNHRDSDDMCEVSVASSMEGHQTVHCRPNPNFHSPRHVTGSITNVDEEEEDEDCFYEDQDDLIQQPRGPMLPKPSEKTPLHAAVLTSSNPNSSSFDVRGFHGTARHWPHSAEQSNHWDKECLLAYETCCHDDETGL